MPNVIGKLPPAAEAIFKAAVSVGAPGSLARRTAVDRALDQVQAEFPEYFVSVPEQQIETANRKKNVKINLNMVRGSFLNVFEAKAFEGGTPKFSGKFIIEPGSPQAQLLDKTMLAVAEERWPGKGKATLDKLIKTGKPKNIEVCYVKEGYAKDGDQDEVYDGFEGMHYLSASADTRPLILDRDKTPLVAQDGRPYSGCWNNLVLEIWAQDNKWGKGIRCTLKGIQFVKDGDAFSGGAPASMADFDEVTEGADAGDLA